MSVPNVPPYEYSSRSYEYSSRPALFDNFVTSSQKLNRLLEVAHTILNGRAFDVEDAKRAIHELLLQGKLSLVQDIFNDKNINPLEIAQKLLVVAKACDAQRDPLLKSERETLLRYELVKASRFLIESTFSRNIVQNGNIYKEIQALINEIHATTISNEVGLNFELECVRQFIKIIESADHSSMDFCHSLFKAIKDQDFILGFNVLKCYFPTQSSSNLSSNWYLLALYFSWMGALCAKDPKRFSLLRPQMISYLHHEQIALSIIDTLAELVWIADAEIQEKSFYRGNDLCLLDLVCLRFKCPFAMNRSWQISYQLLRHLAQLKEHPINRISTEAADALRERRQEETNQQLKELLDAIAPAVQLKVKKNQEKSETSVPSHVEPTNDDRAEEAEADDTQVSALDKLINGYVKEKKYDEALDALNDALHQDPQNYVAFDLRAKVNRLQNHNSAALQDLNQCLVLNPTYERAIFRRIEIKIDLKQEKEALEEVDRYLQRCKDSLSDLIFHLSFKKKYVEALLILNHILQKDPNNLEALRKRGDIYYRDNQSNKALIDFKRCLTLRPDDLPTLDRRSDVLISLNQDDDALKDLNRWLALTPKDSVPILKYNSTKEKRGSLYIRLKKYKDALQDFTAVIEDSKQLQVTKGYVFRNAKVYVERAKAYEELTQYDKAADDLKEALKIQKTFETYLLLAEMYRKLKNYRKAIEALTGLLTLDPENASVLEMRANFHLELKEDEEALEDLSAAIEIKPSHKALGNRGTIYYAKKQFSKAKADLIASLQLKEIAEIHDLLADIHQTLKEYEKALHHFTRSLTLKPENADALKNCGLIHLKLGNKKAAFDAFTNSIDIQPTYTALVCRADLYIERDKYSDAVSDLRAALKIEETAEAHEKLGEMYRLLEKYDYAIDHFDRSLELEPRNSSALESRGAAHLKLKKHYDRALQDLNLAIKLNPKSHFALKKRSDWYLEFKEYGKALKDITAALDLKYDADYLVQRGVIYVYLDEKDLAKTDFKNALKLDPDNEQASSFLRALR